ncbi:phosphate ABC transporter permease subunit PstC [Magnetospirillum sp. XM-1]|uniref:phosphate ABC transporter permease subunit PstC n=1 Tax=Magnetospirillum sp. XM-1 TaxID=1663591 RepID=UPI000838EA3B|nr:phosphate ABC transporter permease subunit PstC [Magnetospirillum sp. XM-1]
MAALVLCGGTILFAASYVLLESAPVIATTGLGRLLFLDRWQPSGITPSFGLIHAWVSTVAVTALAMALAVPVGLIIGLFLSEVAQPPVRAVVRPCLDLLAGIPSVVYGFFGYVALLPWLEQSFGMATGESMLAAGLVLAVMILPYVGGTSAEAFQNVPFDLREAALAHGTTRFHVIRRVVIPAAATGLFTAVALGLARALGETLAVLMLSGNATTIPLSPFDRGQPLTALIATELGEAGAGGAKYQALFAAGALLMVMSVAVNSGIWALKHRMTRHAAS